jgi:hypothetical protein
MLARYSADLGHTWGDALLLRDDFQRDSFEDADLGYPRLIQRLVPNVLVKGGDWTEDKIIGADVVKQAGGVVKSLPFVTGYSTTALIEKIRNRGNE